jgi:hypothetical protein
MTPSKLLVTVFTFSSDPVTTCACPYLVAAQLASNFATLSNYGHALEESHPVYAFAASCSHRVESSDRKQPIFKSDLGWCRSSQAIEMFRGLADLLALSEYVFFFWKSKFNFQFYSSLRADGSAQIQDLTALLISLEVFVCQSSFSLCLFLFLCFLSLFFFSVCLRSVFNTVSNTYTALD